MTLTLDQLEVGAEAIITKINTSDLNRRRLMDLGMLPGTPISVAFRSPLGDPVAYRVRASLIALRREQAGEIEVRRIEESA